MGKLDWDGARRREIVKRRGAADDEPVESPAPTPRTDSMRIAELQRRMRQELASYAAAKRSRPTAGNLKMRATRIRKIQKRIDELGG